MTKHVIVNSKAIDILAVLMLMSTIVLISTSRLRTSIWAYAIRSFVLTWVSGLIAYFSGTQSNRYTRLSLLYRRKNKGENRGDIYYQLSISTGNILWAYSY